MRAHSDVRAMGQPLLGPGERRVCERPTLRVVHDPPLCWPSGRLVACRRDPHQHVVRDALLLRAWRQRGIGRSGPWAQAARVVSWRDERGGSNGGRASAAHGRVPGRRMPCGRVDPCAEAMMVTSAGRCFFGACATGAQAPSAKPRSNRRGVNGSVPWAVTPPPTRDLVPRSAVVRPGTALPGRSPDRRRASSA